MKADQRWAYRLAMTSAGQVYFHVKSLLRKLQKSDRNTWSSSPLMYPHYHRAYPDGEGDFFLTVIDEHWMWSKKKKKWSAENSSLHSAVSLSGSVVLHLSIISFGVSHIIIETISLKNILSIYHCGGECAVRFKIQDQLPYTHSLHQAMKLLICKFSFIQKYETQKYEIYLKENR